ncbi:ATP-binding cassette domain-containing protein [Acaryochloris sp. IP29b_bin.137]|uniref:ATP-binding cassette domain-containing protein n=1 Tax=Acaryochloris sp. IP29b_bin.137 TaxID=2969217 RepID=UPI002634D5DA|nr:ATP-binding cassette domain-containing protein [Acaryochloris sp. IP29b_bin.137]
MSPDSLLTVNHLNHYFGEHELQRQVLFDINLAIQPEEIIILTGPSGAGKTTLLTLLGGLRSVQMGSIRFLGQELRGATEAQRIRMRRQIGFIFQSHNLMPFLTAKQNVQLSFELFDDVSEQEAESKAEAMLSAMHLGKYINYYPQQLSVGQKQRIAISRALVISPQLVLADEPTASLDSKTGRDVVELMQDLAKKQGSAVLIVTHDNRILGCANRIMTVEDGHLREKELEEV